MYTLDTNAIIYYAQGDAEVLGAFSAIFKEGSPLFISTVSEIELFGFSLLTDSEAEQIERFLRAVTIIPLDSHIARTAASLRHNYGIKTIDSAIAATSLATHSTLVTRNTRDFSRIPELNIRAV